MQAILEVKNNERPYQVVRSPWLKDSSGPMLFKMLSKIRPDGQIEAAYVIERRNGCKTVLARTTTSEEKFNDAVSAFRTMVWQFFPDVDLKLEEIEPIDSKRPKSTSQYTTAKNTKRGMFWLRIKKWLSVFK